MAVRQTGNIKDWLKEGTKEYQKKKIKKLQKLTKITFKTYLNVKAV